jgi:hypothetical protein
LNGLRSCNNLLETPHDIVPREKDWSYFWDKHLSHYSDEVMKFIKDNNNDNNNYKTIIISALMDEGLTLIIQVPDVAVNKIFKQNLKEQYSKY